MEPRLDPVRAEARGELRASRRADDVEVIDVARVLPLRGEGERETGQRLGVARGERAPPVVHRVEPTQEHPQRRRLKFAEAQVEADLGVHVLVETPVVTQPAAARGDLVVVCEHGATVAHRREILRRVERERGGTPEGADAASVPRGALGLGAVLEHPEAEARGEVLHGRQRSEEHTSELQSLAYLVCRLLLEKKKKEKINKTTHRE